MSKQKQVQHEAATPAHQDAGESTATTKVRVDKDAARGPKGAEPGALIFVKATSNPKRPGSRAAAVFDIYKDGMTVQAFLDEMKALGLAKDATPNLVYDTAHGFIQIEGYTPAKPVERRERAPKAPKAEKAAKAPRAKKGAKATEAPAADAAVEATVVEETIG